MPNESVVIAGMSVSIRRFDRLVTSGELVSVKLSDRDILIDKTINRRSFVAGLRAAEQLNRDRRGALLPIVAEVD